QAGLTPQIVGEVLGIGRQVLPYRDHWASVSRAYYEPARQMMDQLFFTTWGLPHLLAWKGFVGLVSRRMDSKKRAIQEVISGWLVFLINLTSHPLFDPPPVWWFSLISCA